MRRDLLLVLLLVGPSCGDAPPPTAAQIDGLLQRIDAMERRLDRLEDAAEPAAKAEVPPPSLGALDPTAVPRIGPSTGIEGARASISVTVRAHDLLIDGAAVEAAAVRDRLREAARANPGARLVLVAEPDVPHAKMVEVLDLAREVGLGDVAMSVRVHGEGDASP